MIFVHILQKQPIKNLSNLWSALIKGFWSTSTNNILKSFVTKFKFSYLYCVVSLYYYYMYSLLQSITF